MRANGSFRLGALIALAIGCASAGNAGESGPAANSGLTGAQEEFKQLKPRGNLPGVKEPLDLPKLGGVGPRAEAVPYVSQRLREQSLNEKKAAERDPNWLVNAVMKEKRRDARSTGDKEADETEAEKGLDPLEKLIAAQLRGPSAPETLPNAKQRELEFQAVNPLTDYMRGWISSRDRDLLLGDLKSSGSALNIAGFPDRELTGRPGGVAGFPSPSDPGALGSDRNPYLDLSVPPSLSAPVNNPVQLDLTQKTDGAPGLPSPVSAPSEPEPKRNQQLAPPGLSKPEEDARYFPQLKRF